jgi:hypothetical protein
MEGGAVADDAAGSRRRDMGGEDDHVGVGDCRPELLPRGSGSVGLMIAGLSQLGPFELQRTVDEVPGQDGPPATSAWPARTTGSTLSSAPGRLGRARSGAHRGAPPPPRSRLD